MMQFRHGFSNAVRSDLRTTVDTVPELTDDEAFVQLHKLSINFIYC